MSADLVFSGINVYAENEVFPDAGVVVADGCIANVGKVKVKKTQDVVALPSGWHLIPGMIDMHVHGAVGVDVMDATPKALATMSVALLQEGVTGFLPTTMTAAREKITAALENIKGYVADDFHAGAQVLGVNLEGPFLAPAKAGAQMVKKMLSPNINLFNDLQKAAGGLIKIATIAPELEDSLALIQYVNDHDVIAALGHSDADYDLANMAIKAGVTQATHLFNAMHSVHHRDPGAAIALLLDRGVYCEVIADGLHLHPGILRLILATQGVERTILITDAMRAKQLDDGEYDLGGQQVVVKNGAVTLADGTFAGSVLRMDQALRNMMLFTQCGLEDACKMVAGNPARQLGVFTKKGSIAIGKDADLVVLDDCYRVKMTIVKGEILYRGPAV